MVHKGIDGHVPRASPTYRSVAAAVTGIFSLQRWRFEVQGLEHVPRSGGVVIAANHVSFWDFFTVARPVLHELGRPVRILAKQGLFHLPGFGLLMRRAGHLPVERGANGEQVLQGAIEALAGGEVLLVMPEATVSRSFDLLPFKSGAARMAAGAGVPLVPAASWGSQRFHTVGRRMRPVLGLPVSVAFGAPLRPGPQQDPEEVTRVLRQRVAALVAGLQDGYPDRELAHGAWWQPARLGGTAPPHDDEQSAAWRPDVSPPGET